MDCIGLIFPWGDTRRFNSYSRYTREQFGTRVQKIAVSSGLTCPNRDGKVGTGGCTFCLNEAFSPSYSTPGLSITKQIENGIAFHAKRGRESEHRLAYFQSYSNTYASVEELHALYDEALTHPAISGLIVSTRPDCITPEILDLLNEYQQKGYYVAVEYGVESVYNQTLADINRGHDFECAQRAIMLTVERGIPVGAHFILGLPGETRQMMAEAVETINSLPINTIKFHQLQIFRGTAMAEDFCANPDKYYLMSLEEYLDLLVDIVRHLREDIVIERFASEVPHHYRLNAGWGIKGHDQLIQLLEARLTSLGAHQGDKYNQTAENR